MTHSSYLSAQDQAKIDAKLAEIQQKSGQALAWELSQKQQIGNHAYLLEVSVNGRILQPVSVPLENSAERICAELDRISTVIA